MAKFFAKEQGARVMVQGYGEATAETPVEVPESVAAELRKHPGLFEGFKNTFQAAEAVLLPIPAQQVEEIAPTKRTKPAKGEKE